MGFFDFFGPSTLWINTPGEWQMSDDGIRVFANARTDFFIDEEGPSVRASAHFCYREVQGDFDFSFRARVEMKSPFDSVCAMLLVDDLHWAKLCYENWMTGPSIVSVVTKEYSDDCPSHIIGPCTPFLRIVRSNNCFGFYYSLDGANWILVRYFQMRASGPIKLGIAFQCPTGDSCLIDASELKYEAKTIKSAKAV